MVTRVAVAGASGYAGGETLRLLAGHPEVEIGAVTAHSNAGTLLGEHQPHLRSLADRVLLPTAVEHLVGHDVVVLALPHGASGEIAAQLPEGVLVLDLGADHRLESAADWSAFYGSEHAGTWPYGLPELLLTVAPGAAATETKQRERLVGARRVAVPGCNVTAVTLGIQPGVAAGLVEGTDLVAVLANGYSGAGSRSSRTCSRPRRSGRRSRTPSGAHRHIPEIAQNLRAAGAPAVSISFTPTLVPMSRGILATVTARLSDDAARLDPAALDARVRQAWEDAYVGEPFVRVLPAGQWPTTAMTLGANTALVQVAVDHAAGRVVTVTAIDNLVKGTAGAAVQSMNIALGLPQTAGLTTEGSPRDRHHPAGFPGRRRRRRAQVHRRARRRARRQRRAARRRRGRAHDEPRVRRAGRLDAPGRGRRAARDGRRAQLGRRERVHGPGGLRRHAPDRGARRRRARDVGGRRARLLDGPHRRAAAHGEAPRRRRRRRGGARGPGRRGRRRR